MLPGLFEFAWLIYPRCCEACGNGLNQTEKDICLSCLLHLPKTGFHASGFNPLRNVLKGRLTAETVTAYFFFDKRSRVQRMLHGIKYKGKKELASTIGEWYGHELKDCRWAEAVDVIVPVPLHPAKQAVRGYNQSEAFAAGLSRSLGTELDVTHLYRNSNSSTQTRKTRLERWENVHSIFEVRDPEFFRGKSVLLVDDVITTGATLEACGQVLQEHGAASLHIAAIACALKI